MVDKISFKNYKSFREKQVINLKPITVLIGKNSSGKSAISKLLTLISGSLSGMFEAPVRGENRGIRLGLSNSDLVYNKNTTTSILEFELSAGEEQLDVIIAIDRKDKPAFISWSYNGIAADINITKFKGFKNDQLTFKALDLNFDYIGPIREVPKPNYTLGFDTHEAIGINGGNAYPILIEDSQNTGELVKKVSEWYKSNFEGWKVEIFEIPAPEPTFQVVLSNEKITQINIVNVGQGMNQALPLIVRSYMTDENEVRIIIEEPETHLHPAAHGNLAERFVDSFLEDPNKKYLIETHSQNFLLRMRRLVAQKKLDCNDLALYYVDFDEKTNESTIRLIEVDAEGDVKWWPEGIFLETLTEARAIRDAQLKDEENVD